MYYYFYVKKSKVCEILCIIKYCYIPRFETKYESIFYHTIRVSNMEQEVVIFSKASAHLIEFQFR